MSVRALAAVQSGLRGVALGKTLEGRGDLDGAVKHLDAGVELALPHAKMLDSESDDEHDALVDLAEAASHLAVLLARNGQFERSIRLFEQLIALMEEKPGSFEPADLQGEREKLWATRQRSQLGLRER